MPRRRESLHSCSEDNNDGDDVKKKVSRRQSSVSKSEKLGAKCRELLQQDEEAVRQVKLEQRKKKRRSKCDGKSDGFLRNGCSTTTKKIERETYNATKKSSTTKATNSLDFSDDGSFSSVYESDTSEAMPRRTKRVGSEAIQVTPHNDRKKAVRNYNTGNQKKNKRPRKKRAKKKEKSTREPSGSSSSDNDSLSSNASSCSNEKRKQRMKKKKAKENKPASDSSDRSDDSDSGDDQKKAKTITKKKVNTEKVASEGVDAQHSGDDSSYRDSDDDTGGTNRENIEKISSKNENDNNKKISKRLSSSTSGAGRPSRRVSTDGPRFQRRSSQQEGQSSERDAGKSHVRSSSVDALLALGSRSSLKPSDSLENGKTFSKNKKRETAKNDNDKKNVKRLSISASGASRQSRRASTDGFSFEDKRQSSEQGFGNSRLVRSRSYDGLLALHSRPSSDGFDKNEGSSKNKKKENLKSDDDERIVKRLSSSMSGDGRPPRRASTDVSSFREQVLKLEGQSQEREFCKSRLVRSSSFDTLVALDARPSLKSKDDGLENSKRSSQKRRQSASRGTRRRGKSQEPKFKSSDLTNGQREGSGDITLSEQLSSSQSEITTNQQRLIPSMSAGELRLMLDIGDKYKKSAAERPGEIRPMTAWELREMLQIDTPSLS